MSDNTATSTATTGTRIVMLVVGAVPGDAGYKADIERLESTLTMQGVHHATVGTAETGCTEADIERAAHALAKSSVRLTTIICSDGVVEGKVHGMLLEGRGKKETLTGGLMLSINKAVGSGRATDVCFVTPCSPAAADSNRWLPKGSLGISLGQKRGSEFLGYVNHLSHIAGESDWSIDGLRRAATDHQTTLIVEPTVHRSNGWELAHLGTETGMLEAVRAGQDLYEITDRNQWNVTTVNPLEIISNSLRQSDDSNPPPPPYTTDDPQGAPPYDPPQVTRRV